MDTIKIYYKDKHGRKTIGMIDYVDPQIRKQTEDTIDQQYVTDYKGERKLLKDLMGDCVIDVNGITLAQLDWLCRNREVIYCLLENGNRYVALGIKQKVIENENQYKK